jgi:PAS domain S-box-containing protein
MTESRKTYNCLVSENRRLRAQVAQLEDRLDHLAEHGAAANSLREVEALHREVMNVVSDAVLIADDTGQVVYVSPNAHLVFGRTAEEILKQGRINFVLPTDLFDPAVLNRESEISNIECQIRDAVGRTRNLLVTVRGINRRGGTVLYACRDITERLSLDKDRKLIEVTLERKVEERTTQLRESGERYRRLVEGVRDQYLFYATDPEGTVTYISPSVYTILGYTPDQVLGQNWRQFVDTTDDSYPELERLEKMRFAGIATPPFSAVVLHANGETRLMEFRDAPLTDANGRVTANEGIGKDITERVKAENELRQARDSFQKGIEERTAELSAALANLKDSEDRYKSVVNDQLDFIVRWQERGECTFCNQSYCADRNLAESEVQGADFLATFSDDDRAFLRHQMELVTADDPVISHDQHVAKSDGRVRIIHWRHRALFDNHGRLIEYQSVGNDVTEHRRRERQSQDLAVADIQFKTLTQRERSVMRLVVEGNANKVIARKLALSVKTIEKHRSSLMKKLQVDSVPELVRMAMLVEESGQF